jgi:lipopolysaccharide export system protein LptC
MSNTFSWASRAAHGFRMALPLVVLAALAAYTWWLVQSMPTVQSDRAEALPASLPDFRLAQARVERFSAEGQRMRMLQGKAMRHFESGDRLVVDDMMWLSLGRHGGESEQQVQGQAREGQYSGEAGMVYMQGQARVIVTQANGAVSTFTGEQLSWSEQQQVLRADKPVRLVSPQGQLQAESLVYHAVLGQAVLSGRVTGKLQ